MATRYELDPKAALFPNTAAMPALVRTTGTDFALAFDGASNESAAWQFTAPSGLTGTLYVDLFMATTGTTGDVDWDVSVQAVTPADALNILTTTSYATVNSTDNTAVPGSAGYLFMVTVTLTNADSMAAGDRVRLLVTRDAASDVSALDVYLLGGVFRDSA